MNILMIAAVLLFSNIQHSRDKMEFIPDNEPNNQEYIETLTLEPKNIDLKDLSFRTNADPFNTDYEIRYVPGKEVTKIPFNIFIELLSLERNQT